MHNIDNPVAVKRPGSLEALMGSIQDRMLTGMTEQHSETHRRHLHRATETARSRVSTDPVYEEIPTYDPRQIAESRCVSSIVDIELLQQGLTICRGISAMNEKGERVLLYIGLIDILQT